MEKEIKNKIKTINVLTAFFISYKSDIKMENANECPQGTD